MTRAFYRGYMRDNGQRAKQVTRLHVLRDDPALSPRGWCGTPAGRHSGSTAQIIDPMPDKPPAGLRWCPPCIGHLAAERGLIGEVAYDLAGAA